MAAEFLDSCWENPFVVEPKDEAIELQRVVQGHELWSAIEAAQFACMVVHDEPCSEQEDTAITAFFEAFSQFTEAWEETPPANKATVLQRMGGHVQALEEVGLFVHSGCVERKLEAPGHMCPKVPLAVVSIDRTRENTTTVMVPSEMTISMDDFDDETMDDFEEDH
jgi:hypothetical protein